MIFFKDRDDLKYSCDCLYHELQMLIFVVIKFYCNEAAYYVRNIIDAYFLHS